MILKIQRKLLASTINNFKENKKLDQMYTYAREEKLE